MKGKRDAMGKKWIFLVSFLLFLCLPVSAGAAESAESEETRQVMDTYLEFYGDMLKKGTEGLEGLSLDGEEEFSVQELLKQAASGDLDLDVRSLLRRLLQLLLGEVYGALKMMAIILGLSVLSSYLTGLDSGFGKSAVGKAAYYAVYILIAGVASAAFYDAAGVVQGAIQNLGVFMRFIVPVMITTLLTSGAIVSASVFEPVLLSVIEIAVGVIEYGLIPLVMITTALNIVNGLSSDFKADRLVKLLNTAVKWSLSVMLTIFISVAGLQSIASAGVDGLTVKLSKFAASNLIPVVGGILAESVETVMNCSVVIKNSVGVVGIIAVVLTALMPILKICAILIIFRLSAAVAEPVSDAKIITCISRLADSISVLFSMLAAVTVMFVIILTVVVNAGSSVLMLGR